MNGLRRRVIVPGLRPEGLRPSGPAPLQMDRLLAGRNARVARLKALGGR